MRKLFLIIILFSRFDSFCQVFDPTLPNEEYLKELVLQKINAKRLKRKGKELVLNSALQHTADQYISKHRYKKFENTADNKTYTGKRIKKAAKINGYKNAFIDFQIVAKNAMDYYGTRFYYDKDDSDYATHLFLGTKPTRKEKEEPGFKLIPMKNITYDELATQIARSFIRDDGYFNSLNNGYDKYGLALTVDAKTLYRRRIPVLKVILIVGGNRITW